MSYEITVTDNTAPFDTREIRLSNATPDGQLTFGTFAEAKRVLLEMLTADLAEARQRLDAIRWNMTDVRETRKAVVDRAGILA
jgi:hypothetical protein